MGHKTFTLICTRSGGEKALLTELRTILSDSPVIFESMDEFRKVYPKEVSARYKITLTVEINPDDK